MTTTLNVRLWLGAAVCALLAMFAPAQVQAQVTYPPRIGEREFVADLADMIKPEDKAKIKTVADKLLTDQGIPLQVVTINSMADYGARGWSIERYAMNLFDEWQIGHQDRNTGILLLVSKNDRKVRIEMGAMFTHERDMMAADIINRIIVPNFKKGQFSEGISQGAQAIATQIAGGSAVHPPEAGAASIPMRSNAAPPTSRGSSPTQTVGSSGLFKSGSLACFIVPLIGIFLISMLFKLGRRLIGGGRGVQPSGGYGPSGWGGGWGNRGGSGLGGTLGGLALGGLLGHMWGSRSHGSSGGGMFGGGSSSGSSGGGSSGGGFGGGGFGGGGFGGGGGFSGGSFGGGFSGGGGATGSW